MMLRNCQSQVYAQYVAASSPVCSVARNAHDSERLPYFGEDITGIPMTQRQQFADLLMPWEHYVCSECFQNNPYAIWLVKQQCFEPRRHRNAFHVLIAIDQNYMDMVNIRPLPPHYAHFKGRFLECWNYLDCPDGTECHFAHSEIEVDTWNVKKRMIKANHALMRQIEKYCKTTSTTCIFSEVCQVCAESSPSAVWLAWLKCIYPEDHCEHPTVTVVCSSWKGLVKVRQLPATITELEKVTRSKDIVRNSWAYTCHHGEECTTAHTDEEFAFWRWQIIKKLYAQLDPEFTTLCATYEYPVETSAALLRGVQCTLTRENYISKYHKLVYLDELAHSRKMIKECDGPVHIRAPEGQFPLLKGISSAAMDYAYHNNVEVTFSIDNHTYHATVIDRNYELDVLVIKVHSFLFHQTFAGQHLENVTAHFDIKHSSFKRLHKAITFADSEDIIDKLLPAKHVLSSSHSGNNLKLKLGKFPIDSEYQRKALTQMLSCNPKAPYLAMGPFGTGKTYILAAAIAKLLEDPSNKLLVCAHHNHSANWLYRKLQKSIGMIRTFNHVIRLVPNEDSLQQDIPEPYSCCVAKKLTVGEIAYCPAFITTFTTALHLREVEDINQTCFTFTHILIDEGAQSREPEALGALVMANSSTRIIIVGDNKQVGPQVEVLSKTARENGLGTSLLERLYNHYKGTNAIRTHTATLLTNYRCHPSILTLASSLLYEGSLLSRSDSKTHPNAPFPLVFACSSLNHETRRLPSVNEKEAETLVLKMLEFIREWPKEILPKGLSIGLLASTRQQVACLRRKFRQYKPPTRLPVEILPTYNIQGKEFAAVFLSTAEPTDKDGKPYNVTKSICNEYIFNTVITRARSLVYSAGNPFVLQHMGTHFKVNCWQEFIQRCIQCQTLLLSDGVAEAQTPELPRIMEQLSSKVFLSETLEQATTADLEETDIDVIVERYFADLQNRKEYQICHNLVQSPSGTVEEKPGHTTDKENVVWCKLECSSYRTATAVPLDSNESPIKIETLHGRRLAFHKDVVKVDTIKECVLLDDETEAAICKTHFGASFLCMVDPKNPILFNPLDIRHPKFVNLPTIAHNEKCAVVCFDPNSIRRKVKVNNVIPFECAMKMLFIVKFLGWRREYSYPLGIIIGAMPPGYSTSAGDRVLRFANNIHLQQRQMPPDHPKLLPPDVTDTVFTDAFTIDPKGSTDHDDALTCSLLWQNEGGIAEYEIGVHITNVHKYIPQCGSVDNDAHERGCSVYRAPDDCISHMLPKEIIDMTNLTKGQLRDVFSVLARVRINNRVVESVIDCKIMECQIVSALELTYSEAQTIICNDGQDLSLREKIVRYNHAKCRDSASIESKLGILWKVARFLRQGRLGEGASCYQISDPDEQLHPEAHFLIQEYMIWANYRVAKKLLETFPDSNILRRQGKPNHDNLKSLLKSHGPDMAISLALNKTFVPTDVSPSDTVHILEDTVQQIHHHLQSGNVRKALHIIQLEHLHPQTAVGHNQFRRKAQSSTDYCISSLEEKNYWHESLRCDHYTHFTSPIRRYIDVVVQRLLHAALEHLECPYRREELEEILQHIKTCSSGARDYERDFRKLTLASELLLSRREFLCFVTEINNGKLYICFRDLFLKVLSAEQTAIHLKNLNASETPPQIEIRTSSDSQMAPDKPKTDNPSGKPPSQVISSDQKPLQDFTWKAKVTSFTGSPDQFLSNPFLQLTQNATSSRYAKISLFQPDGQGDLKYVDLKAITLNAGIKPFTKAMSIEEWRDMQSFLPINSNARHERASNDVNARQALLQICTRNTDSNLPTDQVCLSSTKKAPLWIYEVHRPVQSCEVMRVDLSATCHRKILRPCIQLLEVGPGLDICTQHNAAPSECFADKLTENASKKTYRDVCEYFQRWEPVILAEASVGSVTQTELLIVREVTLKWPELMKQTSSAGQAYYQLVIPEDKRDVGVRMDFPDHFVKSSYDFFRFGEGDLVCVRYGKRGDDNDVKYTFHMVVSHVVRQNMTVLAVYLKFVGNSSNYIPVAIANALKSDSLQCEMQLIPLPLPFRRVYRSLSEFKFEETKRTLIAEQIALGKASMQDRKPPKLQTYLAEEDASIATSLWPLTRRTDGRTGRKKVNTFQRLAIELACCDTNRFVMIQGPPGTGKSVTGAHLAFALAMRLPQNNNPVVQQDKRLRSCVMYCGPSQQSVNVVLDILTSHNSPVRDDLNIVRIYSKAIERKDFPGPHYDTNLFRQEQTSTKCERKYKPFALHHIIRERNPEIKTLDEQFVRLQHLKKVPSLKKREDYRTIVFKTELEVLRNAEVDIVLCTCNEASSHRVMESLKPVYCIIDECAMATEPECMVPIRRAEHVILIGDHCQLQPVIQYREAAEMGLGRSLFERYVDLVGCEPHRLEVQYRMHEELCKFPSHEFYDGILETDKSVKQRKEKEAHLSRFWPQGKHKPFVFCDVVGQEGESHTGQKGKARVGLESKYNEKEAKKIVQIVKSLIVTHKVDPKHIAALSPYSAQREEIKKQLGRDDIQVKTITESQGSEYGIVLLSTVRSRPLNTAASGEKKKADLGWLRANLGFITDRHQICVGITRCKYGLVIVGNKLLLSYDPTWKSLIEYYKSNGCIRRSGEFPPADQ